MLEPVNDREIELMTLSTRVLEQTYTMLNASWLFRFA